MQFILPIIYGSVQGLTEFIPVSSSGHLLLLHSLLPSFTNIDEASFDAALNIGTLIALFGFFWRDLLRYLTAWLKSFQAFPTFTNLTTDQKLAWYLFLAAIPAGLAGLAFQSFIESTLRSPWIVITMLVLIALAFFWVEKATKKIQQHTIEQVTGREALTIGIAQALALIPGTSRSGITIITGMMMGLSRADAARFSFLLSAPIILAATLKKTADLASVGVSSEQLVTLGIAVIFAAIVGIIAIAGLLRYLSHRSLAVFAWYRIGLAVIVALILFIK